MRLRTASVADITALSRLWYDGWREAHLAHVPAALAADRTVARFAERLEEMLPRTVLAEDEAGPLGFCAIRDGELDQMFVEPRGRGTGVAGRLIADAEGRLVAAGWQSAHLYVIAQNARARAFYERHGWANGGQVEAPLRIADAQFFLPCLRYEKRLGGE